MGKHTYIVVLKRNNNDVELFYQELESLVSRKITNRACRKQNKMPKQNKIPRPKGICKQPRPPYWICSFQMNELKTESYLAEFYIQDRGSCKFSVNGKFELGGEMVTQNSIYVDHLEKSSLDSNTKIFCV